jgi:SAM-dependent methyltransferase
MSTAFDRQLRRGQYRGTPPDAHRLPVGVLGSVTPPEPDVIAARAAAFCGFTHYERGWIHGTWYCGTKRLPSSYWGQFPGNLPARIHAMFPVERMLHLCSGHLPIAGALNIDLQPVPSADVQADAEHLPLRDSSFTVAVIDPPYSEEDAQRYGCKRLLSSPKVMAEARRVLVPGGYLVWLDERYPAFRRDTWTLVGLIGVVTGFERRTRVLSIFRSTKGAS